MAVGIDENLPDLDDEKFLTKKQDLQNALLYGFERKAEC